MTFDFDSVSQMTGQQMSDPANYLWHPAAAGSESYGTANSVNQYPTVGGIAQSYGTDGALTGDGTWTFGYNTENMLVSATKSGTSVAYSYDPLMRQGQKTVGSAKTNYYYGGWQRLADYDGVAGTLLQRYVYGTGVDDILLQVTGAGVKTYFHANHQGSVIATTDSSGSVVNRFKYGPFGESPSMAGTTHGYTGQRFDSDTGLYYYKARYYSPKLGRFLQPDPLGFAAGMNFYSYVGNAPLFLTDSSGLKPGNPFKSMEAALADFAANFPIPSASSDYEQGAALFSVDCGKRGKTWSYTDPVTGSSGEITDLIKEKAKIPSYANFEGLVHNHGADDRLTENRADFDSTLSEFKYDAEEQFSAKDALTALKVHEANPHAYLYLTALSGNIYRFRPLESKVVSRLLFLEKQLKGNPMLNDASYHELGKELLETLMKQREFVSKPSTVKGSSIDDGSFIASCDFKGYKGLG